MDWKIQTPELLGQELAAESDRLGEEVEKQEQYWQFPNLSLCLSLLGSENDFYKATGKGSE